MDLGVQKNNDRNDNSPLTRPLYVVGIILLALVIAAFAGVMVPRLFGVMEYAVETSSMEPALQIGSLAFVTKQDPKDLNAGDIIAYMPESSSTTASFLRVVENDIDAGEVQAKGDAAGAQDVITVTYEQIKGTVSFSVPLIGNIFKPTKNKWF